MHPTPLPLRLSFVLLALVCALALGLTTRRLTPLRPASGTDLPHPCLYFPAIAPLAPR